MTVWRLDVDRVLVIGSAAPMNAGELRALIESAVRQAAEGLPLPGGRSAQTAIEIASPRWAADQPWPMRWHVA